MQITKRSSTHVRSHIIVHFLEEVPIGYTFQRKRDSWPLHITLLPWFTGTSDTVGMQCTRFASEETAFQFTFGEQTAFNTTTNVTLLDDYTTMQALHRKLYTLVRQCGGQFQNTKWVGDSYVPHMTHHAGRPVPYKGETRYCMQFSLVTLLADNICRVERHSTLRSTP
jgi:2'-5' RNA ligase